jgi:enoyl-CoA hydratase
VSRNATPSIPRCFTIWRAYGEYEADAELRCAVVFAHGDHFTGGIDLAEYSKRFAEPGDPFSMGAGEIDPFGLRNQLTKPMVIAVHGISFTIAIEMLLAADVRIAARGTRFAQIEICRGLYPLGGATFRLVREAGWGNAMRYLLTGDEFGPDEAFRLGLVQEIAEPGEHTNRAIEIAERIAAQAPLGVRATLKSAWLGIKEGEPAAAAHLRDDMPAVLTSEDFAEGVQSFHERRKAVFRGK